MTAAAAGALGVAVRPRSAAAAAIAAGAAADAVFGDPRRGHPVAGFGRVAAALERCAHRDSVRAGAVYAALLAGAVTAAAAVAERALRGRPRALAALRAACLWTALGGRSLGREAHAVAALVDRGEIPAARQRVRSLVGRDPEALDGAGLCRAAIESLAENTVDAVVAPLAYAAVAGAPGALGHRAVNTLDAMVGHRSPRHARFGTAAARADDVLNWPPARLGAGLAVVLAPAVGGTPVGAARAWARDAGAHPSPNAGVAEAAFAGALGVRLGGTLSYGGRVEHRPVLGDGRDPGPADVARAARLARLVAAAATVLAVTVAARPVAAAAPPRSRPAPAVRR
jgi:adenosylcobinamide-phosphate synthase